MAVVRKFQLRRQIASDITAAAAAQFAEIEGKSAAVPHYTHVTGKPATAAQIGSQQAEPSASGAAAHHQHQLIAKSVALATAKPAAVATARPAAVVTAKPASVFTAKPASLFNAKLAAVATSKPTVVAITKRKRQESADSLDTEQPAAKWANSSEESATSTMQDQSHWVRRSRWAKHVDYSEHCGGDVDMEDAPELSAAAVPKRKKTATGTKAPWC